MRKKKNWLYAFLLIPALGLAMYGGVHISKEVKHAAERSARQTSLKQIGLAFKMYANESKGGQWPSRRNLYWQPCQKQLGPYLGSEEKAYLQGKSGVKVFYLGYLAKDSLYASVAIENYIRHNVTEIAGKDLLMEPVDRFFANTKKAYPSLRVLNNDFPVNRVKPLAEGVERFLITDICSPAGSSGVQAIIPVLWEVPDENNPLGGNVLYMDGHVEFVKIHEKFPMTYPMLTLSQNLTAPYSLASLSPSSISESYPVNTNDPGYIMHMDLLDGDIPAENWIPNIYIGDCAGYRIMAGIPLVLFPVDTVLPNNVNELLWPNIKQGTRAYNQSVVDMGTGHGYRWFGLASVVIQEAFREHLGLMGGDNRLQLLQQQEVIEMLIDYGDQAVPYFEKYLLESSQHWRLGTVLCELDKLHSEAAQQVLINAFDPKQRNAKHLVHQITDYSRRNYVFHPETIHLAQQVLQAEKDQQWIIKIAIQAELGRDNPDTDEHDHLPTFDGISILRKMPRVKVYEVLDQYGWCQNACRQKLKLKF